MNKEELIISIAGMKAEIFISGKPEDTGLTDFLKNGFSGLNDLEEVELSKIHNELLLDIEALEKGKLSPKNFMLSPVDSVLKLPEYGIVAKNIMVILFRTGNKFRELPWEEYVTERTKENNFSELEKQYFDGVIGFCKNAETAKLLSPVWAEIKIKQ